MVNAPALSPVIKKPRRNLRQELQREQTRGRLLEAARHVFARHGYQNTTVELVLTEAGVSRAGFYAHFESKLGLVVGIAETFAPKWRELFLALGALKQPDLAALRGWSETFVDFYRCNSDVCILLTQVVAVEDSLYSVLAGQRDELIRQMAELMPSFAQALVDPLMRMRVELLLTQLDHAAFLLTHRQRDLDPGCGPQVMAEQIGALLAATGPMTSE